MRGKKVNETLEKVVSDYNEIAEHFDVTRKYKWKEFDEYLEYVRKGDRVLDLGCGNGRLCGFLNDNIEVDYTGADNSENLLKLARKNFPKSEFVTGNLTEIPFCDATFDSLFCIAAFHHLPTVKLRKKSLNEIARVIKPGGYFIISVWNLFRKRYLKLVIKSYFKAVFSLFKYAPRDCFVPWRRDVNVDRYYYAFFVSEMRNLLSEKFEVVKVIKGSNFVFICRKK